MKPARLTPPARSELRNVAAWYAERSPRLGWDFVIEVRRSLQMIETFPGMGAPVPYVDESDTRRFPIRRFPYQVVYVELEDRLEDRHRGRQSASRLLGGALTDPSSPARGGERRLG